LIFKRQFAGESLNLLDSYPLAATASLIYRFYLFAFQSLEHEADTTNCYSQTVHINAQQTSRHVVDKNI